MYSGGTQIPIKLLKLVLESHPHMEQCDTNVKEKETPVGATTALILLVFCPHSNNVSQTKSGLRTRFAIPLVQQRLCNSPTKQGLIKCHTKYAMHWPLQRVACFTSKSHHEVSIGQPYRMPHKVCNASAFIKSLHVSLPKIIMSFLLGHVPIG